MTGTCRRFMMRSIGGVMLALLATCGALRLQGEETGSAPDKELPIVYRRIFVPADNTEVWPLGGETYLPVEVRDFESWTAANNRAAAAGPSAAKITEAVY